MMESNIFALKNKKEECPGVFILSFVLIEGRGFDYRAGQFAIFHILKEGFFNNLGRAYTIISSLGDDFLTIAVKKIGIFSGALCGLEIGDKVGVTGPYGNFYPSESDKKDIVLLAGGIGVTPFCAIIKDFYKRKINKKTTLIYSNRNKKDIIFFDELAEISKKWKNLKIVYILTREKEKIPHIDEYERMDIKIIKKYLEDLDKKVYFICGPSDFVINIKEQLKNNGVNSDCIKIEAFY